MGAAIWYNTAHLAEHKRHRSM